MTTADEAMEKAKEVEQMVVALVKRVDRLERVCRPGGFESEMIRSSMERDERDRDQTTIEGDKVPRET